MSDRFEIKKIWIPLGKHSIEDGDWVRVIPTNDSSTEAEWQKASQLANEGWDLVGSVPITMGAYYTPKGDGTGFSTTAGYVLLLKRRIE